MKKVRFEEESKKEEITKDDDAVVTNDDDLRVDVNKIAANEVEVEKKPPRVSEQQEKVQRQQQPKFQYGNYSRYYGYRLEGSDPRLGFFNPNWFADKDVLDIGCNVGEVRLMRIGHSNYLPT